MPNLPLTELASDPRHLLRRYNTPAEAQELTQDALLKLFNVKGTSTSITNEIGYQYRTAESVSMRWRDILNKGVERHLTPALLTGADSISPEYFTDYALSCYLPPSPLDALFTKELRDIMTKYKDTLTEEEQVMLDHMAEKDQLHKELADKLGVDRSTLYRRLEVLKEKANKELTIILTEKGYM